MFVFSARVGERIFSSNQLKRRVLWHGGRISVAVFSHDLLSVSTALARGNKNARICDTKAVSLLRYLLFSARF